MTFLYCLVHTDPTATDAGSPEELGFFSSPVTADAARRELLDYRRFAAHPDGFAIVPFQLDAPDQDVPVPAVCFGLYFEDRIVERDESGKITSDVTIEKTLTVFSSGIKAAEALVVKLQTQEYADLPSCFRITQGTVDEPDWKTEADKLSGPYSTFSLHRG